MEQTYDVTPEQCQQIMNSLTPQERREVAAVPVGPNPNRPQGFVLTTANEGVQQKLREMEVPARQSQLGRQEEFGKAMDAAPVEQPQSRYRLTTSQYQELMTRLGNRPDSLSAVPEPNPFNPTRPNAYTVQTNDPRVMATLHSMGVQPVAQGQQEAERQAARR
jgi:hypothetical protein